jgi:hypothetical protein
MGGDYAQHLEARFECWLLIEAIAQHRHWDRA